MTKKPNIVNLITSSNKVLADEYINIDNLLKKEGTGYKI